METTLEVAEPRSPVQPVEAASIADPVTPQPKKVARAKATSKAAGAVSSKAAATPAEPTETDASLKEAEALGLASAFQNLKARLTAAGADVPAVRILQVLRECEGLVNKAKAVLLSSATSQGAVVGLADSAALQLQSPEKQLEKQKESEKDREKDERLRQDSAALKALLSGTVVETAPSSLAVEKKAIAGGLSIDQQQRIADNRAKALARKQAGCA